jgi:hypothetical protein
MFSRWNGLTLMSLGLIMFMSSAIAQEGSTVDPRRPLIPESQMGSPSSDLPFFSPSEPQGCEINRLYIDDAGERARKIQNSYVIAVARLGTGERSVLLNRRRLSDVKNFLEQIAHAKVVTAQSERVTGYGVIELYVGGKLLYKLPVARNRGIYLGSCEF